MDYSHYRPLYFVDSSDDGSDDSTNNGLTFSYEAQDALMLATGEVDERVNEEFANWIRFRELNDDGVAFVRINHVLLASLQQLLDGLKDDDAQLASSSPSSSRSSSKTTPTTASKAKATVAHVFKDMEYHMEGIGRWIASQIPNVRTRPKIKVPALLNNAADQQPFSTTSDTRIQSRQRQRGRRQPRAGRGGSGCGITVYVDDEISIRHYTREDLPTLIKLCQHVCKHWRR